MFAPVLIGLMVANADAQFGVTGGVNISGPKGISNASVKDGVIAGVFMQYGLVEGVSLRPELLFSVKGANWQIPLDPLSARPQNPTNNTLTLTYVEVPILLRLDMLTLPILPINVDIFAGPDFALNVGSSVRSTSTITGRTTVISESGNTYPFDFNIAVGAGPSLNLGSMTMGAEARYTFGTSPVLKNETVGGIMKDGRNGVWSIMASLEF